MDEVIRSPLANQNGFIEVDKYTFQHIVYKNVFSLGYTSSIPATVSPLSVPFQADVVAQNLIQSVNRGANLTKFDGHAIQPVYFGDDGGNLNLRLLEYNYNGPVNSYLTCKLNSFSAEQAFVYFKQLYPHYYSSWVLSQSLKRAVVDTPLKPTFNFLMNRAWEPTK